VAAIPAQAVTSITTCGFAITTPGNYSVDANLNCPADAIDITASGVSLKLNGHILTGSGTGTLFFGIKITSAGRLDHVAIQGPGLIRNFLAGVGLEHADYSQVSLVTTSQNSVGIAVAGCTFATVASNNAVRNVTHGIVVTGTTGSVFTQNEASGNQGDGFDLDAGSVANTVNNNFASGNGFAGIELFADNTRVSGNVTDGNAAVGIVINNFHGGNQVFSNTSSVGNGALDLVDNNASCGTNLWSDNNVSFVRSSACVH
jgi:parallel beta-helix repeat protein